MGNEHRGKSAHSAEYFGSSRDFWWNADFLALLGERWALHRVGTVLDVGSGVGHWGRCLLSVLPATARLEGVDPDPSWVAQAEKEARAAGFADRARYRVGAVERLPFDADTFDLVTCQTVLIHVADPRAALAEMIRVARPGGLVAVAEPNNATNTLVLDSTNWDAPVDDVIELARFQLLCERGKAALGLGDNSVGDRLPAQFAELGLTDLQVHLNDRASPVFAPYDAPDRRAHVDEIIDWTERGFWVWSLPETRRYYDAGGGAPGAFDALWERALASRARQAKAIAAGTYATAGGGITYVVAGRKPLA
jgi:SAM-dependent methyltransferase